MSVLRRFALPLALVAGLVATGCSSELKIGAVISESGAVESYGDAVRKGMDVALEEINAAGGFNGTPISIVYKDDATNAQRGTQVTQELIDVDGVRVIIGAIASNVTLAIAPVCEENRVVLLSPTSSARDISNAGDYVYRNFPSDIIEGTAMAKFAKDLDLERVVVFAATDTFATGLSTIFSEQYSGKFREVVKTYQLGEEFRDDYGDMVAEVKTLAPDGIYIVGYLQDIAALLGELDSHDVEAILMGSASVTADLIEQVGDAAENLVYPQPNFDVDSDSPEIAAFVAAYRAKYDEEPDIFAAHGYDAVKLIVEAAEVGGSAHPDDIRLGLSGIKDFKGAAGPTVFDEYGDVVRYPRIFIIRDGRTMPYEQFVADGGSLFDRG